MGLLDEIWQQDTTLIDVLDETGIENLPQFKTQLDDIQKEQVYQKSQLDSLGYTLNNYQQSTEASLLSINTRIDSIARAVELLDEENVRLRNSIINVQSDVKVIDGKVEIIIKRVDVINQTVNDLEEAVKAHNREIETLDRRLTNLVTRVNSLEPSVSYLQNFLIDSTAVFEGSNIVIVDIGGTTIEWAYTTIGTQQGRLPTSPVKFVVKYLLAPSISLNNVNYVYISFIGIGRTNSQPVTSQDTLVSWGYQQVRLWRNDNNYNNFSVFTIKSKYDRIRNVK